MVGYSKWAISHILKSENYELCFLVGSFVDQITPKKRYSCPAVTWNFWGFHELGLFWRVPWSNYDWKKLYSCLAIGCNVRLFWQIWLFGRFLDQITNYDRKKRYSRLAIGWNVTSKTCFTMVEPFAAPSSMAMGNQPMPLRYPLCKRLSEGGVQDFLLTLWSGGEIFFLVNTSIYINLIYYPTWLPLNNQFTLLPCSPCRSQLPPFTSFVAPACFWLVVVWFSFAYGRQRPGHFCCCFFFSSWICHSKQRDNTPLHVPPRSPLLFNAPPTIDANFWLVVVSSHQTVVI